MTLELSANYVQHFESFTGPPRKHPGKQTLTNKFKWAVAGISRQFGAGLVSKTIAGEGKRQVATLIGAVLREGGGIIFTRVAIHARWLDDPQRRCLSFCLRTMVNGHALQRAIQAFHTADFTVLAPEFYAHAIQVRPLHAGGRTVYTMTERGLAIWQARPVEDPTLVVPTLEPGDHFYFCKTYLPADQLTGQYAIRRQRWLEGRDFQQISHKAPGLPPDPRPSLANRNDSCQDEYGLLSADLTPAVELAKQP